ncbi:MAG TPA: HPr(Ser) kinase/phosphatase [Thermoanaerobaculia bacterium]|nr:HPr(Ser) kinase/phosphatase [Thermoanaerobaculia bacterium]
MESPGAAPRVTVRELLSDDELAGLELTVLAGEERLDNPVVHPRVQKPGLAFAGYYPYIKPGRVQIVGESEIEYVATLPEAERVERFDTITALAVPAFVVTKGLEPPAGLLARCRERKVPLLRSTALSSSVIKRLSWFLEEHLVPSTHMHGVFLDIYGIGVLLVGESGVGKSECAMDLITRGHSLVADDRVTVKRYPSDDLIGYSEGPLRHHMELRGLGIVNVQDLFGLAAVRERKGVDLVIELEHWREGQVYDRLGLDETLYPILEVQVPYIKMPVALGRNLSILVEIAARNHVLKLQGHHSGREFARKLEEQLERDRRRHRDRAATRRHRPAPSKPAPAKSGPKSASSQGAAERTTSSPRPGAR